MRYNAQVIADMFLRLLGENPAAFPQTNDKWAAVFATLLDIAIPFILFLLFLLPFVVVKIKWKKFTVPILLICLLVGSLLAYFAYLLNEWSYGYGFGVIFNAIYNQ
jgi:uncharacterized membrane protein